MRAVPSWSDDLNRDVIGRRQSMCRRVELVGGCMNGVWHPKASCLTTTGESRTPPKCHEYDVQ